MLGFSFRLLCREGSNTEAAARGWTETVGNSLGRAPSGGSEMEATTGWTEGKLWEIAWGELRWEGARRKRHEATTRWTEGKPWEIAWGELCWEGARRKRGQGGRRGNRGK